MRNIWRVFCTDLRSLSRSFFACAVVVGIVLLPSLYAWLNIYSNWDPYGNTGGISIAVASLDKGYDDDGTYVNKGQDVVDDLREATSINWVIVDTEQEATDGVYAGDYYAAVVIDEDFSSKMYRMLTDWTGKPAITYYENAKKNAVATKITDTAVESLKRSISENYLEVVISGIMEQSNLLAADLTEDDPEAAVKGLLYQAQDLLAASRRMMDAFDAAGSTGGEEAHTITEGEMPSHGNHLMQGRMYQELADNASNDSSYRSNTLYLGKNAFASTGNFNRGWKDWNGGEMYPAGTLKGGGNPHNNMPPYLAVYTWKRTA